ncbi:MAG: hypothetical protein E7311_02270 [Clostridiales bacterium]|nr:hypothetical protein [Clostridiales bacterium]
MKKIKIIPILIIFSILIFSISVSAFGIIHEKLENIINYLNNDNEDIYSCIDTSNTVLSDNINTYMGRVEIAYKILKSSYMQNGKAQVICNTVTIIDGKEIVRGEAYFDFIEINNTFILTDTDLFSLFKKTNNEEREEQTPHKSFMNFISHFRNGDIETYDYIDNSNIELANNIDKYIENIDITCSDMDIDKIGNDKYKIECEINAKGERWSTSGFKVEFKLMKQDNKYVIYETNLFEIIGPENIANFAIKLVGIIVLLSIVLPFVFFIVIFITIKKHKNKIENTFSNNSYEEIIDNKIEEDYQSDNNFNNDNPIKYE